MIAVMPIEGSPHVYTPGTLPIFSVRTPVRVELGSGDDKIGSVTFDLSATEANARATELTYLLAGAFITVQGEALFEVYDETLLHQALAEVLVDQKKE